jgi:hypothetical protein
MNVLENIYGRLAGHGNRHVYILPSLNGVVRAVLADSDQFRAESV